MNEWARMDGRYGGSAYVAAEAIEHVLGASLAPDHVGVTDLLARWSADDYATDTSVRRAGIDASTGARYRDELAFEVACGERRGELEARARLLARRGVRRIFAVFVKAGTVEEWSRERESWQVLDADGAIEDRCLSAPLAVRGLLAAAAVDLFVTRARIARWNAAIEEQAEASYHRGYLEAQRQALQLVLGQRKLALGAKQRARVDACEDSNELARWLGRALTATHADEIFSERRGGTDGTTASL